MSSRRDLASNTFFLVAEAAGAGQRMSSRALRKLTGGVSPAVDEEDSGDNLMEPVKHRANAFNAFSLVSGY